MCWVLISCLCQSSAAISSRVVWQLCAHGLWWVVEDNEQVGCCSIHTSHSWCLVVHRIREFLHLFSFSLYILYYCEVLSLQKWWMGWSCHTAGCSRFGTLPHLPFIFCPSFFFFFLPGNSLSFSFGLENEVVIWIHNI